MLDLRRSKRRRRLVHDQESRLEGHRRRDLDHLHLRHREPTHQPPGGNRRSDGIEERSRLRQHRATIEPRAPRPSRLPPHEDVLGHAEIGKQRRLLEDHRHPESLRLSPASAAT